MEHCAGIGVYIDTARFVPANMLFKQGEITRERVVGCYELVVFLKDGGYTVINGKKHPITGGATRFLRPGDRVYNFRYNEIYVLHFSVDDEERGKRIFGEILPFLRLPDVKSEIIEIFERIVAALLERNDFQCVFESWRLFAILRERSCMEQKGSQDQTVLQIKKYIEENFSRHLTLEEIADRFYLHPIYMQRKFKRECGMTPAEYQKQIRLSKAKLYLLTTMVSVDDVSERCGFCNPSYFISVFKKSEGLTPFQYRQKNCF